VERTVSAAQRAAPPGPPCSIHGWRWLRRGGLLLVTLAAVEQLVPPPLVSARDDAL
jgi:hypothetical protein